MGIQERLGTLLAKALPSRFGASFVHTLRSSGSDVRSWLSDDYPDSGRSRVDRPYAEHGTTATAVEILSSDAASVGWELSTVVNGVKTDEKVDRHPVLDLWRMPNRDMLGEQLFVGTYLLDFLFGEAFWYYPDVNLEGAGTDAISRLEAPNSELHLLDPRSVSYKVKNGSVSWYLQTEPGRYELLDSDKLTQFKRYNPYEPLRGLPKILAIIAEVEGDVAAARYNRDFFSDRNGVPTGLIIPSSPKSGGLSVPMDDSQRREFLRTFNARHSRKRGVGMLPSGYSWVDLGLSQRDMDFRALRAYSREEALGLWGVPPFLAGVLEKANYANAREQKEVYWQGTINRFLSRYTSAINFDFFPKVGIDGLRVSPRWDTVRPLLENLVEKTNVAREWFAMGVSKKVINERLELGWNPDDLEDYEDGYLPLNLIPTSLTRAESLPEPSSNPERVDTENNEDESRSGFRLLKASDANEVRRGRVWKNIIVRTRDIELAFERVVRSFLKNLEDEALRNLDSFKGYAVALTKNSEGFEVFDVDEANRVLRRRTKPHHAAALMRGGESVLADLGLAIGFNLTDPVAMAIMAQLQNKIVGITSTVETALRASLVEGLSSNETIELLRDRVRGTMRASLGRARTIARTESGFAFNGGRFAAMERAGIEKLEWLSSRDADVRDSHAVVDGTTIRMGETFSNGLRFPNDPSGPPEEVINCRCVAVPVVETE